MIELPSFTMRQLLEAGVHFGHKPCRWNPKMSQYIYGTYNGIHIIDLQQTFTMLRSAMEFIAKTVSSGGRVLFVGTKRQASERIAESAKACGQYFVNHRWLGGMLTNWETVSKSIDRLTSLEETLQKDDAGVTKKEMLKLERERNKLELTLGGIREMGGRPSVLFVIDTKKEAIAVLEAKKLGIPVVAVVDTNASAEGVDYVIPGNDDAIRSIDLYCHMIVGAILSGLQKEMQDAGVDMGASVESDQVIEPETPVSEEEVKIEKGEQA